MSARLLHVKRLDRALVDQLEAVGPQLTYRAAGDAAELRILRDAARAHEQQRAHDRRTRR